MGWAQCLEVGWTRVGWGFIYRESSGSLEASGRADLILWNLSDSGSQLFFYLEALPTFLLLARTHTPMQNDLLNRLYSTFEKM